MPSSLKPMTVASAHHGQVRVRSGVELLTRQSVGGSVDRLSVGPTTAGTRRAAARTSPGPARRRAPWPRVPRVGPRRRAPVRGARYAGTAAPPARSARAPRHRSRRPRAASGSARAGPTRPRGRDGRPGRIRLAPSSAGRLSADGPSANRGPGTRYRPSGARRGAGPPAARPSPLTPAELITSRVSPCSVVYSSAYATVEPVVNE